MNLKVVNNQLKNVNEMIDLENIENDLKTYNSMFNYINSKIKQYQNSDYNSTFYDIKCDILKYEENVLFILNSLISINFISTNNLFNAINNHYNCGNFDKEFLGKYIFEYKCLVERIIKIKLEFEYITLVAMSKTRRKITQKRIDEAKLKIEEFNKNV